MKIHRLFVHAGTYTWRNGAVVLTDLQQWTCPPTRFDVVLVFDYDPSVLKRFDTLPNDQLRGICLNDARRTRSAAEASGLRVTGVQLDLDCPTRDLPKYADLLRRLHAALHAEHLELSATALPTWYGSGAMASVADAVDFAIPQYYEAVIPRTLDHFEPLSNLDLMRRGLQRAGDLGRPFFAGIPSYGHALVYDDRGRLVGVFHDISASNAAQSPDFHFVSASPTDQHGKPATFSDYIGEDLVSFETNTPLAGDIATPRYRVIYELPSPTLIARHLDLLTTQRPRNCIGVILYRFPQSDETQTLPLSALAAAMHSVSAEPKMRVGIQTASAPWSLIETAPTEESMPVEATVSVANIGDAATFMAHDSVSVTLNFDRAGMAVTPSRDFRQTETFSSPGAPGLQAREIHWIPASPERANVLRAQCWGIASGQTIVLGRILLPSGGAARCWGSWSAHGVGNYTVVHGLIPITELKPTNSRSSHADQGAKTE